MPAKQIPFAAVARIVGESDHRVLVVCTRNLDIALGLADFSDVKTLAIAETSRDHGHDYVMLAADADADATKRRVLARNSGAD